MIHLDTTPEIKAMANKAFPSYKGRKFKLDNSGNPVNLRSNWSGGSRDYYVVLELASGNIKEIPQNGTMYDSVDVKDTPVKPGFIIVEHSIFMGKDYGITFYVHPETALGFLPEPDVISLDDRIVLDSTSRYKNTYAGETNLRFKEAKRKTDITSNQWETAKGSLITRGLLNKAGALTTKGRNAL